MIRLEALTKTYSSQQGQVTAVDQVSFEVESGETCVLLGPSGCGKTTTLRMINRLVAPTSGKVFIGGTDTDSMNPVALRRTIGYVIQQIGLFPNMTVGENVSVVPRLLGWSADRTRRRAEELLAMLALEPGRFFDRYPSELSGGQAQRVGVARALAADPPVLLMDERGGRLPSPSGEWRGMGGPGPRCRDAARPSCVSWPGLTRPATWFRTADVRRRQELDDPTDHAIIQLMRLDAAHELAARAVDSGDLKAIDSLLKVLERMDRYHKAAARKAVYDDAARKRLFAKLNRVAAGFSVPGAPAGPEPSNPPDDAPRP
jgi:ABC-type lipoprotein export system ATPase subunit